MINRRQRPALESFSNDMSDQASQPKVEIDAAEYAALKATQRKVNDFVAVMAGWAAVVSMFGIWMLIHLAMNLVFGL